MIYADDVDWTKVLNANVQSQPQQPTYQQPMQQAAPQQYPQQPQAPQQAAGFQAGQF